MPGAGSRAKDMDSRYPILMYHALRAGAAYETSDPHLTDRAAQPYILHEAEFRRQMELLSGLTGKALLTWETFARGGAPPTAIVTFDDGHRSNAERAMPVLYGLGLCGVFFVTTDWIGQPGYMSAGQLRDLVSTGMLVGAHGRSHRYLSDLPAGEIDDELRGSRARLEDLLGVEVPAMSLPGGRLSRLVRKRAVAAGYRFMFTSRIALAATAGDPLDIPRIPMTNRLPADGFIERLLSGDDSEIRGMARSARVRAVAKALLGNQLYDRLRLALLGSEHR